MDQWSEWSSVTYHQASWCCKNSTYFLDSLNYIGAITTPFQWIQKAISEMQRRWSDTKVGRWTAPLSEQPAESGTRLLKILSCLQQHNVELMNFSERSFGYYWNVWNTVKIAKSEFSGKAANPADVLVQGQVSWRQHSSSDPQPFPPSKTHPQNVILQNCLKYYKIFKESVCLSLPTRRKPAWIVINQINWQATMQLVWFYISIHRNAKVWPAGLPFDHLLSQLFLATSDLHELTQKSWYMFLYSESVKILVITDGITTMGAIPGEWN